MSMQNRTLAMAASLRLPNLPSVWSNILTGVVIACHIQGHGDLAKLPLALIAASCLYFAGNLFNDVADMHWDRKHRPERALPSGLFAPSLYGFLGILLVAIALTCCSYASYPALLVGVFLTSSILLYTWLHKKTVWGIVPMALCRASLPILGYATCSRGWNHHFWVFLPAIILFIYLILLSLRARAESRPDSSRNLNSLTRCAFLLPALILIGTYYSSQWLFGGLIVNILSTLPYLAWTALALTIWRSPIPKQVSALLAGIPLVDAMVLLPYLLLGHLLGESNNQFMIALAWLPAFVLGRFLQRYVPAT